MRSRRVTPSYPRRNTTLRDQGCGCQWDPGANGYEYSLPPGPWSMHTSAIVQYAELYSAFCICKTSSRMNEPLAVKKESEQFAMRTRTVASTWVSRGSILRPDDDAARKMIQGKSRWTDVAQTRGASVDRGEWELSTISAAVVAAWRVPFTLGANQTAVRPDPRPRSRLLKPCASLSAMLDDYINSHIYARNINTSVAHLVLVGMYVCLQPRADRAPLHLRTACSHARA